MDLDASSWLTLLAILLAPFFAVQVSLWLQKRKEKRGRQLALFKTLMATRARASGLALDHVQALNMIDVEFYGKDQKARAILEAWKAYLDHLNMGDAATEAWGTRREDLFLDLLQAMAAHLAYEFDRTDLKRTSYFPSGYGWAESDYLEIRTLVLSILRGEKWLPIYVPSSDVSPPEADADDLLSPGDQERDED